MLWTVSDRLDLSNAVVAAYGRRTGGVFGAVRRMTLRRATPGQGERLGRRHASDVFLAGAGGCGSRIRPLRRARRSLPLFGDGAGDERLPRSLHARAPGEGLIRIGSGRVRRAAPRVRRGDRARRVGRDLLRASMPRGRRAVVARDRCLAVGTGDPARPMARSMARSMSLARGTVPAWFPSRSTVPGRPPSPVGAAAGRARTSTASAWRAVRMSSA